ncbi:MAG: DUF308 domain-containing protein [Anaerolineaceae bacterium]|nr:DUF308 domain-containing protein [Anaerolineaceae bacterium]MBQ6492931.1 DUF308 domain-containing protein [Erysipelotrichaceae bacterium]
MKENLKKYTLCLILMFIIAIIIGVFMVMYPDISLATLGVTVAMFMIFNGLVLIFLDIKAWSYNLPFEGMLQGILRVVLGVLLFRNPDAMAVEIGIVLGVWIILSGFGGIKLAYHLRYTDAPWVLMIIVNVLNILIGAAVLYSPVLSSMALTTSVGMVLIISSVLNIIYVFMIKRNLKELEEAVLNQLNQPQQPVENDQ